MKVIEAQRTRREEHVGEGLLETGREGGGGMLSIVIVTLMIRMDVETILDAREQCESGQEQARRQSPWPSPWSLPVKKPLRVQQ